MGSRVIGRQHPILQEKRHAELQMTCFSCPQVIPRHWICQLASACYKSAPLTCSLSAQLQLVGSHAVCQLSCTFSAQLQLSAQLHTVSSDEFVISAQRVAWAVGFLLSFTWSAWLHFVSSTVFYQLDDYSCVRSQCVSLGAIRQLRCSLSAQLPLVHLLSQSNLSAWLSAQLTAAQM